MRTKNRKEDKMDTREEFVGKFELGNKVDITDPCYNKGVWCRMTTDCKPGTWYGYATISDEGEWGDRVATLCIYLDDRKDPEPDWELIGDIGVDAEWPGSSAINRITRTRNGISSAVGSIIVSAIPGWTTV